VSAAGEVPSSLTEREYKCEKGNVIEQRPARSKNAERWQEGSYEPSQESE
jgi:hypothetical protein